MEDQLGALGLVVNAIALWNARYLQAALGVIERMRNDVLEEDVSRLSPLKRECPASSRVESQAPTKSGFVTSTQGVPSLTIAFNTPNNFRRYVTKATFFAFPAVTNLSYTTFNAGLWIVKTSWT
jgi:Tn3 transposase DDE domain